MKHDEKKIKELMSEHNLGYDIDFDQIRFFAQEYAEHMVQRS